MKLGDGLTMTEEQLSNTVMVASSWRDLGDGACNTQKFHSFKISKFDLIMLLCVH